MPSGASVMLAVSVVIVLFCPTLAVAPTPALLSQALHHLAIHKDSYIHDLTELVAIPTVSALPEHTPDILAAAAWLKQRLAKAGLQNVKVLPTEGAQPVVYADWLHAGPSAPTALLYAHYDVQVHKTSLVNTMLHIGRVRALEPVDPVDEWFSPPFRVTEKEGQLYGRGTDDDKGGLLQTIHAVEAYLKTSGELPINVKFLLEGQEELLSPNIHSFLERSRDLLAADLCLSADGHQISAEQGSIGLGRRGIVSFQIDVQTASVDLHSGTLGGSVANSNHVLAELLAGLHTKDGRVAVAGFYDGVVPVSAADQEDIKQYNFDAEAEASKLGVLGFMGEVGYSTIEQRWHRPTLEVVGMSGGFTGVGVKTVVPRAAFAKVACRLVTGQDPEATYNKVASHVANAAPAHANVRVTPLGGRVAAWESPRRTPGNLAAARVIRKLLGNDPLFVRDGATIPALSHLRSLLSIDTTVFGWGLGDGVHAPNERLAVQQYELGRRAWALLLWELKQCSATAGNADEEFVAASLGVQQGTHQGGGSGWDEHDGSGGGYQACGGVPDHSEL